MNSLSCLDWNIGYFGAGMSGSVKTALCKGFGSCEEPAVVLRQNKACRVAHLMGPRGKALRLWGADVGAAGATRRRAEKTERAQLLGAR
jgi:hypothetical protein